VTPIAARAALALIFVATLAHGAFAQAVEYTLSLPAPQERWMLVDARFPARPGEPLEVRMSRSSPGRYATHEFAKNLFALEATHTDGTPLAVEPLRPDVWRVVPKGDAVRIRYRLFGDHIDGTYFAVDDTHAHINAPAVFLWAPSLSDREARVRLVPPTGRTWRVFTQLFPTTDAHVFTAPNLQYLLDSPIEFSAAALREFTVAPRASEPAATIRVAMHHLGTDTQLDTFVRDLERIVLEQRAIYGELPAFDTGTYTFLMDYLPWAHGDGMEHRNSTVCTSSGSLSTGTRGLLGTASHEFFHAWNVERIRPASLEPFDFTQANMSGDLWLAEGFTSYYGELVMRRAGLIGDGEVLGTFARFAGLALISPGVQLRSAVEMSRLAPFVDAAAYVDRTNWDNTYLSYYTYGAAIGLGLDLTLRQRTEGRVTLDDFMRALWQQFGKVAGKAPGYAGRPYTIADLRETLATVSSDRAFADAFFARHIEGREPIDFASLFAQAGLTFTPRSSAPWLGLVRLEPHGDRAVVASPTMTGTPIHRAGLNRDDEVVSLGGRPVRTQADWDAVARAAKPGQQLELVFVSRGTERRAQVSVTGDPRLDLVPVESAGGPLTPGQRAFREAWLGSRVK
jgi:predicted metalloprotease with PDZ domain